VTKDSSRMTIARDDICQAGIYETADRYVRMARHLEAEKGKRCKMTRIGSDLGEGVPSMCVLKKVLLPRLVTFSILC
jgi:hypothetical protein